MAVFVQRVPGIGRQGPEALEAKVRFHVYQVLTGFQWVSSREVPGPWDEGRLIHLRDRSGAARREAVLALYTWGDLLFLVEASAPAWRFKNRTRELEELVSAFQYEPPPRPFLPAEVAARVKQATVLVWTPYGTGSGFIVHDGASYFILTNHHVVRDPQGQVASTISILLPGEKRGEIEAKSFNANPHTDVVLLHTPGVGKAVPALALRKAWPTEGTPVVAIGYPLGEQFRLGNTHPEPTLNPGTVLQARAKLPGVYDAYPVLKTDLGVNPGNSGGPVVDLDGAVVGMVVAGHVGSETSFVIPTEGLLHIFRYSPLPKMSDGSSPQRTRGELEASRHPESVREALRAATVAVHRGNQLGVGVVLQVPEGGEGLVLTVAGRAKAGDKVDVDFFPPGSPSPLRRAGTVRYTETDTGLALVAVEDFPGRPRGVPLGQPSGVKETDQLLLAGHRDVGGVLTPMHRYAVLTGIERAERWRHGAQAPARLRVDVGIGRAIDTGPAVDRDGALAGFVIQHTRETNITVLAASEQLRELLAGRVRSVAARAWRDGSGGCQVEFFVDAEAPLALPPRTVSLALDAPAASLEDDALVPSFGPDTVLGTLERRDSTFRLSRPSCPESMLTYRLQLTSGLTVQTVEGQLPLPARALGRTQSTVSLGSLDTPNRVLNGFLSWSDGAEGTGAQAPATLEAALVACTTSYTACGSVVTLGEAGGRGSGRSGR